MGKNVHYFVLDYNFRHPFSHNTKCGICNPFSVKINTNADIMFLKLPRRVRTPSFSFYFNRNHQSGGKGLIITIRQMFILMSQHRLLRSLCFLYSLLIAGLCHSVKNRGGAISNDRMVQGGGAGKARFNVATPTYEARTRPLHVQHTYYRIIFKQNPFNIISREVQGCTSTDFRLK